MLEPAVLAAGSQCLICMPGYGLEDVCFCPKTQQILYTQPLVGLGNGTRYGFDVPEFLDHLGLDDASNSKYNEIPDTSDFVGFPDPSTLLNDLSVSHCP